MPTPITSISPAAIQPVRLPEPTPSVKPGAAANAFDNVLADAIQRVENYRQGSESAIQRFLSGEDEELHKVAIAAQQAELSFELFLQVRRSPS
jgi:flagellar hook-basal body complex protein FliE